MKAQLYQSQSKISDFLYQTLTSKNQYLNHSVYLAGQVGVGKTYITADICTKLINQNIVKNALIVVPPHIKSKWLKVLKMFDNKFDIKCLSKADINNQNFHQINIVSNSMLTEIVTTLKLNNLNKLNDLNNNTSLFDFLIVDEVHEYTGESKFKSLLKIIKNIKYRLLLSGTYVDAKADKKDSYIVTNMLSLVNITHPKLFSIFHRTTPYINYTQRFDNSKAQVDHNIVLDFEVNIWSKIAAQIAIQDIEEIDSDVVYSEIAPIIKVAPDNDEDVQYQYLKLSLRTLPPNQIAEILDVVSLNKLRCKKLTSKQRDEMSNLNNVFYTPNNRFELLIPSTFYQTPDKNAKINALVKLLNQTSQQKNLILVKTQEFAEMLKAILHKHFNIDVGIINRKMVIDSDGETKIKKHFDKFSTCIGVANAISTGLDIEFVDNLIWYQLFDKTTDIIQANGRIYRTSSQKRNKIHFIVYENTEQETLLNNLVKSIKINQNLNGLD